MQFKTNHSPGPFSIQEEDEFANCMILDSEGYRIAEQWSTSSDVVDAANMNLFKAAPAMLEYMMNRADFLSRFTHIAIYAWELKTLLAILKDAGVEVVEK